MGGWHVVCVCCVGERHSAGDVVAVSVHAGGLGSLEDTPAGADVCHDGDDVSGC